MALTFAIDPGNTRSAYVVLAPDTTIIAKGILPNDDLRLLLREFVQANDVVLAIEMIASYGMASARKSSILACGLGDTSNRCHATNMSTARK